jgi:hypothetical protein
MRRPQCNVKFVNQLTTIPQASHVRCIYKIHAKNPTILDDEPKAVDPKKLTSFKMHARHARESILGHNDILWRNGNVLPGSGAEMIDLGIDEDSSDNSSTEVSLAVQAYRNGPEGSTQEARSRPTSSAAQAHGTSVEQMQVQVPASAEPQAAFPIQQELPELESLDFFRPFHDPEMLDLFPNGEPMEFSFFQTSPASLDLCDLWASHGDGITEPCMTDVG